jgi:predicted Zn-dependent protease
MNFKFVRIVVFLVVATCWIACSVNPATGKRQLMLVSSGQEQSLGADSDRQIVAQMGLYEDAEIARRVETIGKRLAAASERPDLPWTFRVIDDPVVNAFALPGGYVYVTRGILAHLNSEAELAAVLGHEIGHVTARHGANRMSKGMLAQIGLAGSAMAKPEFAERFGQLAEQGVGMMFLKYSRDAERQADELGLRYIVGDGWDPRRMADVFGTLKRVGENAGSGRLPGWLSTHPAPENRVAWAGRAVDALALDDLASRRVGHIDHLTLMDGLVFGEDPRRGFFEENAFYHPEMAFQLTFPAGWKTQNGTSAVMAVHPEGDAAIELTLAAESTTGEAWEAFRTKEGLEITGTTAPRIGGRSVVGGTFKVVSTERSFFGEVAFVSEGGKVFRLMGYADSALWGARRSAIVSAIGSFGRLTDRERLAAAPARLSLVTPSRSLSAERFATTYRSTVPAKTLLLINGIGPGAMFDAGKRYKVVTGGR